MKIHALAPRRPGERRSPVTPDSIQRLVGAGHEVTVEVDTAAGSGYGDSELEEAGAQVRDDPDADLVVCVEPPSIEQVGRATAILGLLEPLDDPDHLEKLASGDATCLAFELVPRTTRAQSVDALSSQATLAGYQAMVEGASLCDRIMPMLTTAAGTLRPGRVLVLGAGVAGLQAIATARRLGAMVHGFDVRAAASEQVESLGATFVTVDMEAQDSTTSGGYAREVSGDSQERLLAELFPHVAAADVVVTTAAIPGRKAPLLVTAEMVEAMRPGAVVIDGAALAGGNCELSRPGETIVANGVTVAAPLDLASRNANHASQLYARNVENFLALMTTEEGALDVEVDDDIVQGATAARGGEIVHEWVLKAREARA